jgi:hypothetical protein
MARSSLWLEMPRARLGQTVLTCAGEHYSCEFALRYMRRCGSASRTNSLNDPASNSRLDCQNSSARSMRHNSLSVGMHWMFMTRILTFRDVYLRPA